MLPAFRTRLQLCARQNIQYFFVLVVIEQKN
jgi:hypothetical protein